MLHDHVFCQMSIYALDAQSYATYDVINEANIVNLRNVLEALDMGSLKKRFDKIWNKNKK